MRSWIFGGNKNEGQADDRAQNNPQGDSGRPGGVVGAAADALSAFRRGAPDDAEVERKVSLAARNLCYGVQRIVLAAKGKSGVEWKAELLNLLGGADDVVPKGHCDLDVLLVAPKNDKFILRCLENELPPNMIHCLRLLRVLELQHANQKHKENEARVQAGKKAKTIKPISSRATSKVSQLLCTLCTDPSVGEQLRPHLFGLLALSGASYPASGVHVAKGASQVIIAFAENCLSNSLVWFLHDRKMIIHMTDDIKELCGLTADGDLTNASTSNALSLYGAEAEKEGLWAISLSTVIHLVVHSCRHNCKELMKDFEAAKGNEVLKGAILQSKSKYGKELMNLIPLLASCNVSEDQEDTAAAVPGQRTTENLAVNTAAFDIMEELMFKSLPFLQEYDEEFDERPNPTKKPIKEMAEYTLNLSAKIRFTEEDVEEVASDETGFDVATDLLLSSLQLYSEHAMNFGILEDRCHLLTTYVLAFPTLKDENLKVLILKTVEFVVTGVQGPVAMQPFGVLSEVFVSICKILLKGGLESSSEEHKKQMLDGLFADTDLINESMERLFKFDSRVGPAIMQSGTITKVVDDVTELVLQAMEEKKSEWEESFEDDGKKFITPPSQTPLDSVCAAICRVLGLILGQKARQNVTILTSSSSEKTKELKYLLVTAVKEMGDEAAFAATGVFEYILSAREELELLREDMVFCLQLSDYFSDIMARSCGVPQVAKQVSENKTLKSGAEQDIKFTPKQPLNDVLLRRVAGVYTMLKKVLESSSLARDAFRLTGGFESMVRTVLCLGGAATQNDPGDDSIVENLMTLLKIILSAVDAGIGVDSREPPSMQDLDVYSRISSVTLGTGTLVDPVSSQHSAPKPAAKNLYYLRLKAFYLDFAIAISQTKILEAPETAVQVFDIAMSHMDPSFSLIQADATSTALLIRNPDAARLVLGLSLFLPKTKDGVLLSKKAFDNIIRLCDPSRLGSTLSQLANCGIIWSITNPKEFAPILDDTPHHLYPRFMLLLRRVASFSMSYNDFVSMLRGISGPLLIEEGESRIRLPVITSSVRRKQKTIDSSKEAYQEKEEDFCRRLDSLCNVAERGDRVPFCAVGGDTVNTISVLLHKTKIEDRLYKAADEGRLNFVEVDAVDSTSLLPGGFLTAGIPAPGSSGGERLWAPMATSGFSYSLWFRLPKQTDENKKGKYYLFDMSNPPVTTSDGAQASQSGTYLSLWFDYNALRFSMLASTQTGEPISLPTAPLTPGVWHHLVLTYSPSKRTMMGRKSAITLYVNGRPLETEVKIDSVNLAPNAKVVIGAPNPAIAVSGIVTGKILSWDVGPTLMLSTVLSELDTTAMFVHGPDFNGIFWGDRPQRLSLSATGSAAFALLAETGEQGSVASALRRRQIARLEAAGTVSREMGLGGANDDNDSLVSLGLLCVLNADTVVFAYRAVSCNRTSALMKSDVSLKKKHWSGKLINMARINSNNEVVSSDAAVYGKGGVVTPRCFADNVQWGGGPKLLMPLVYAANSSRSMALALRLIKASTNRHPPNLESMQGGGGYQTLAVLIQGKRFVDAQVLDQAFSFAVHGFYPEEADEMAKKSNDMGSGFANGPLQNSDFWVFSDLDAMKQLLLNHQVWDLKNAGPELPSRLLTFVNGLVAQKSIHKAFNSRRLHLVGIVRWTLHLMMEAAELYTNGELAKRSQQRKQQDNDAAPDTSKASSSRWYCEAPQIDAVSVGGNPDNALLQSCKTLLRRVLTFMLTPGDLEAIAETTMHTVSIGGFTAKSNFNETETESLEDDQLLPGAVARIYLLRLIEELIVDGVNEIVASGPKEGENKAEVALTPHAGGIVNPNQTYFSKAMLGGEAEDGATHPKHFQAQNFLSAFAGVFTPVWFAALLEGCHEEATASAVLRLMILMMQSSPAFAESFEQQGGFAPLILSVPKFSTCSSVIISLLSQLLHVSILSLPCFPMLDAAQLNIVFDEESRLSEKVSKAQLQALGNRKRDPSCGIFALVAECIGRNLQLVPFDNELGKKAMQTNMAILELLQHRHNLSPAFQDFCRTSDFVEPLSQTLCLIYDERSQQSMSPSSPEDQGAITRHGLLTNVPKDMTPLERFFGVESNDMMLSGSGIILLLKMVVSSSVMMGPLAPSLLNSLFGSFPIHASSEQVGGYQMVLMDLVKSTVHEAIDLGEATALAASVGVCSVLLNRLMKGFFTSELALQTLTSTLDILKALTSHGSTVSQNLTNMEVAMISADAAHIARLAAVTTLKRSRPYHDEDPGDPELQAIVIQLIAKSIDALMIVPKSNPNPRRGNAGVHQAPPSTSKLYPLWMSASIARCAAGVDLAYVDLSDSDEPVRSFVVGLMVELLSLLNDPRDEIREAAVAVVVQLLQGNRTIMSGLLIKDIQQGDRIETIDVMNRGGFSALLVAHEVAKSSGGTSSKKHYASFFDWFNRNIGMVELVKNDIENESHRLLPGLHSRATTMAEAVEIRQQEMVMSMASAEASDRTIRGGLERAELAQHCIDSTIENHVHWKRQGFDDLASGAMQWKFLLRRLKGSRSIWEGGPRFEARTFLARHQHLYTHLISGDVSAQVVVKKDEDDGKSSELVKRWKLDLSEGNERQRRRLLPNYEFHTLYGVEEDEYEDAGSDSGLDDDDSNIASESRKPRKSARLSTFFHQNEKPDDKGESFVMEATADLLKELNIKSAKRQDDDDDDEDADDDGEEDGQTEATSITGTSAETNDAAMGSVGAKPSTSEDANDDESASQEHHHEAENATSYELITGLLQSGDWPEESYNVKRCTGLEVRKALLLWCRDAIYVIDGFEQTEGEGLEGRITRVEKEELSYNINLRPKDFKVDDDNTSVDASVMSEGNKGEGKNKSSKKGGQESSNEVTYQHRSQRIAFKELLSVFRRRYQLQHIALEFYDSYNNGTLIAFTNHTEREEILSKVLATPLPNSIFSSSYGTSINYKKFMNSWKSKIVSQWVNGKMTNFEFLMHLNSFAGRTYNDLTQYPVFPWIIADYDSEEFDLEDPKSYRDLSKTMGNLGEERAEQFRERYEALDTNYHNDEESPPPFHYGTHYSTAAYVLYYLMRLEPFSRLALTLQGGRFDVADRLFHNIGSSWKSASHENLQDVRELIPEFFYLPDFLTNTNNFDFGITQKGKTVHNVTLPKWAKGDPERFIRINRQALESDYVSKNLHLWADLIFGYKQRGAEAVKALNTFVHVTYEGEVDLDSMTDPVQRESTIAQIQNFGQTPSRLEKRPFQSRFVFNALKEKDGNIDFGSLSYLAPLTPPFMVVGAPHRCQVKRISSDMCKLGLNGQHDKAVGDLFLVKGQLVGVGRMCALNIPMKTYYRFGYPNSGLAIHVASLNSRNRELNKLISIHDGMHRSEISVAKVSRNGQVLVTGCIDSTVRLWHYENSRFKLRSTFCGHDGWKITCVDISNVFGFIVTACAAGQVVIWDLRTLTFVRRLSHSFKDEQDSGHVRAATSVSINHNTGNILTLVGPHLSVFDVNGNLLGTENSLGAMPTCAVATDCPEWQEKGIVAVTGHVTGEIRFWSLDYETGELTVQYMMIDIEHTCEITALRITGAERQDTLLIGDKSGKMSVCKTIQMENMSQKEVGEVVTELRAIQNYTEDVADKSGIEGAGATLRSFLPGQGDTVTM
mmetsp:Transcript_31498/g.76019  ORF Transcript_31498/g.76019 Transcript_31498/m.76019 type:complete len:3637 (+) Transcript_31498:249-11159(+)